MSPSCGVFFLKSLFGTAEPCHFVCCCVGVSPENSKREEKREENRDHLSMDQK